MSVFLTRLAVSARLRWQYHMPIYCRLNRSFLSSSGKCANSDKEFCNLAQLSVISDIPDQNHINIQTNPGFGCPRGWDFRKVKDSTFLKDNRFTILSTSEKMLPVSRINYNYLKMSAPSKPMRQLPNIVGSLPMKQISGLHDSSPTSPAKKSLFLDMVSKQRLQVSLKHPHSSQMYLQSSIFPSPGNFLLNLIISMRNFYNYFVPDIVKNVILFVLLAYFLIFFFTSLLPLMLISIPIILAVGYIFVKSNKLINKKIVSSYIKYLDNSSFVLKPPYTVDLINYDNTVKLQKIRSLVLQRIKYATRINENNINMCLFNKGNGSMPSFSAEPFVNLSLSELVSLKSESLSYVFGDLSRFSSSTSTFNADDTYDYESLIMYGFNLREDLSSTYKNIAQVNVILGYPKIKGYNLYDGGRNRVLHDEIFEQLFKQQSIDDDLSYQPQKLIVEIIPWNSGILGVGKRFILNTGLDSDDFDRVDRWNNSDEHADGNIITIKKHRTKIVDDDKPKYYK